MKRLNFSWGNGGRTGRAEGFHYGAADLLLAPNMEVRQEGLLSQTFDPII